MAISLTLSVLLLASAVQTGEAECCFSIGYGAFLKPCCLRTTIVNDEGDCAVAYTGDARRLVGGSTGYTSGNCPATAEDAKKMLDSGLSGEQLNADETNNAALTLTPGNNTYQCNCPPTEVFYDCTQLEYKSIRSGKDCPYYRSVLAERVKVASAYQSNEMGCCFSIGYGNEMKPCCLGTSAVKDQSDCNVGHRLGGRTGYTSGKCPTTAEDAATMMTQASAETPDAALALSLEKKTHQCNCPPTEVIYACTKDQFEKIRSGKDCPYYQSAREEHRTIATVASARNSTAMGCCFSIGYGVRMKPCCLEAAAVNNETECAVGRRVGGRTGYTSGTCPVTAEDAAALLTQVAETTRTPVSAANVVSATAGAAMRKVCHIAAMLVAAAVLSLMMRRKPSQLLSRDSSADYIAIA